MEVYVYLTDLPEGIHEAVTPCLGGFTVYIDNRLTYEDRTKAYKHAMYHILNDDFEKDNVQMIEVEAHREGGDCYGS